MAERVSDVPDEAEWPEIEDEIVPESSFMPDAGPFERPFEYLHGARATLDADLERPTRLLLVTAAKSLLRVVEETDTEIEDDQQDAFQRIAEGELPETQDAMVTSLAEMAAFVEANLSLDNNRP